MYAKTHKDGTAAAVLMSNDVHELESKTLELGEQIAEVGGTAEYAVEQINTLRAAMIGEIVMFGGVTPPAGWKLCNGASLSKTVYSALYAVIGDTWGSSGSHFNLPDLRGRAPIGAKQGTGLTNRTLGDMSIGSEDAIVPYHNHVAYRYTSSALGSGSTGARIYNPNGSSGDAQMTTSYAGTSGNAIGANMQPSAVVNFIIYAGGIE